MHCRPVDVYRCSGETVCLVIFSIAAVSPRRHHIIPDCMTSMKDGSIICLLYIEYAAMAHSMWWLDYGLKDREIVGRF